MDPPEGENVVLQRKKDLDLFQAAVRRNDVAAVQQAIQNGAENDANNIMNYCKPALISACEEGYDEIVRILLNAGADARWRNVQGWSVIDHAIRKGHLSTVEMLLNHDNDLLEFSDNAGFTPLHFAICVQNSEIAHFLLDRGANLLATTRDGWTTFMQACRASADPDILRRLLVAGVPIEARDETQCTALHHAAMRGNVETMREMMVEHNANMFAVDKYGNTPFDLSTRSNFSGERHAFLIELYGNKLSQEHGRLALHSVLGDAEFVEEWELHLPLEPFRIHLPLGKLTLEHFRLLLHSLDSALIRNRDESGQLPIHMACQHKAPVQILDLIFERNTAALHMADCTGALPLHCGCCGAVDDSSVRFLVQHGGVGTLAARNQEGAMPLHVLCGSTNPSLRTVQYLIKCYPEALAVRTNTGQYPFMIAACKSSTASLSVVYELVRTNHDVVTPH